MTFLILVAEALLAPFVGLGVVLSFLLSPKRGRLGGLLDELPERCGSLPETALDRLRGREVWWFHAASAGEVAGLAPVLEALHLKGGPALVVTTTTRSGREAARGLASVAWAQLAPLDGWPFVARFMKALSPRRLVLAETELWPTTLILAGRAGLLPSLVNARLTPRSLSRYRLVAWLLAPALNALAVVAAQTEEDAAAFASLGVPSDRIKVTGSAKYDAQRAPAAGEAARARVAALGWGRDPLFVAGSTHPFEEEMVLAAFLSARRGAPGLRLVLAPRHLERAADAFDLLSHAGLEPARWSGPPQPGRSVLLLDEMGVLPSFYALARAAFVGGTLVRVGGHNLLEPASAGVPVLFGPHTGHIERPAAMLAAPGGGGRRVSDVDELSARLAEFAADEGAARKAGEEALGTAESLRGASARILEALHA